MSLPHLGHLVDGHVLGLGNEEEDEDGHHQNPGTEEVEEGELHVAHHHEEYLSNDEGEEHVDGHGDALRRRPDLQGEDLARYQPTQWPPGSSKPRDEDADEEHHEDCIRLGYISLSARPELDSDQCPHDDLNHGGDATCK